jgi:hypothetical protein
MQEKDRKTVLDRSNIKSMLHLIFCVRIQRNHFLSFGHTPATIKPQRSMCCENDEKSLWPVESHGRMVVMLCLIPFTSKKDIVVSVSVRWSHPNVFIDCSQSLDRTAIAY